MQSCQERKEKPYNIIWLSSCLPTALNNINLEIREGEFVAVMGPSGCGKSTLLNIIGMLDNPTSGDYFFKGENIASYGEARLSDIRKQNIGSIFQSFNLIDELTVYQVFVQFSISIALIAATAVIYVQVQFAGSRDPGFNKENLLIINNGLDRVDISGKRETLKQEMAALPNIQSVSNYRPLCHCLLNYAPRRWA
jgi:ABC-type methionine transport system ATPase subunit